MRLPMISYCVLLVAAGSFVTASKTNETVKCLFKQFHACYQPIGGLGANVTTPSLNTNATLNATCKASNQSFSTCVHHNPSVMCRANPSALSGPVWEITRLVSSICSNGTDFLNSSTCYNQNAELRRNCYNKHMTRKTDMKSLCCSNFNIRTCVQSGLRSRCGHRHANYRNHMLEVYDSYATALCKDTLRKCSGAASPLHPSLVVSLAYALFLLLSHFSSSKF